MARGDILKTLGKYVFGNTAEAAAKKVAADEQTYKQYMGRVAGQFEGNVTNKADFKTALESGNLGDYQKFVDTQTEPQQKILNDIGKNIFGTAEKPAPMYTNATLGRMSSNLKQTGEIGLGVTERETLGTSKLLGMMGHQEGLAKGVGALAMGGLLGAGAAGMTGNDKFSGAIAGAVGVIGGRGLSKALSENVGGIENYMMKKVMGDQMLTREGIEGMVKKGDASPAQIDLLQDQMTRMGRSESYQEQALGALANKEEIGRLRPFREQNLRVGNLQRAKAMETGSMSAVQKTMHGMLTKNKGIGMQSRYLVGSGAMLSGVAFSSPRKDRSRGFNRNRGNRF